MRSVIGVSSRGIASARRMDVGAELELVVDHREVAAVGRQPQILGVLGHGERHVRLELPGVHRMAERHGRDELLEIRIARILIELALGDARGERLAPELEPVVLEPHLPGEQSAASANCTENAPSTGQSSFGVNCSSVSLIQNHVPASAGDRSMPVVTAVLICFSGAADSLNTIVSGLIEGCRCRCIRSARARVTT